MRYDLNIDEIQLYQISEEEVGAKMVAHPMELELTKSLISTAITWHAEYRSRRERTQAIQSTLEALGTGNGYLPIPNKRVGRWDRSGEWLFDHMWLATGQDSSGEKDWRLTERVVLAVESEWIAYEYDILTDFIKLTFVQADLRLYIYANIPAKIEAGGTIGVADLCRQYCPRNRGFRYLAIGFPDDAHGTCRIDCWTA